MTTRETTVDPEVLAENMASFLGITEDAIRIFMEWQRDAMTNHDLSDDELIAGCFREAISDWLASQVKIF
jgi:hypothetical protein